MVGGERNWRKIAESGCPRSPLSMARAVGYPLARNTCSNLFGRFSSKKNLHVLLLIDMYHLFTDSLRSITKRCSHIFFGEIIFVFDFFFAHASCKVTENERYRYACTLDDSFTTKNLRI